MGILSNFTLILFCAHFLGDFHLQSNNLSEKKVHGYKYLLIHLLIHAVTLLVPIILLITNGKWVQGMIVFVVILFAHLFIDFLKVIVNKRHEEWKKPAFVIDQLLHLGVILFLSEFCFADDFASLDYYGISRQIIDWFLLLLLISKPANVLHRQFFSKYDIQRQENATPDKDATERGAGALIGNLERILSVIFLHTNQVAAIGLIYTAKSIARFKEIEVNKRFAEYYLIGTLYSILYAIAAYYLVIVL